MVVNSIIVINIDDVAVENDYVPLLCEQLPEGSNSNSSSNPINQKTLFSRGWNYIPGPSNRMCSILLGWA